MVKIHRPRRRSQTVEGAPVPAGEHRVEQLARRLYRRFPPSAERRAIKAVLVGRRVFVPRHALLTVVMPVYNVERYLPEAVHSVLRQTYLNLELILVDDGSTDSSGALCDQFGRQDSRIRVIHQANAGLGAARNTGIAAARGTYLAFADSDDFVSQFAYSTMISSLRRSGSDIATGNVRRRRGKWVYQAWNQSRSHVANRRAVTLESHPELLYDTVAWNKVYRTEFWKARVKTFPVDRLYEDMVPVFTAFQAARSIDVLARPVYVWRLRDEQDSITQRLLEPRNIDERFEAISTIDSMIRHAGQESTLREQLCRKVLEGDLWVYVREIHDADDVTIERMRAAALAFWSPASPEAKASIPAERRICYWLLEQDRGHEVAEFRRWYASVDERPPTRRSGERVTLDTTGCPVPLAGIPAAYLDMTGDAVAVAGVAHLQWTSPTALVVSGYAYTQAVSDGNQDVYLLASDVQTGRTVEFVADRVPYDYPHLVSPDPGAAQPRDGFAAAVDMVALHDSSGGGRQHSWTLAVRVVDGDIARTVPLAGPRGIAPSDIGSAVLPGGWTAALAATPLGAPLRIAFTPAGVRASGFAVYGGEVRVDLDDVAGPEVRVWLAGTGRIRRVPMRRDANGSFTARLPTSDRTRRADLRVYARIGGRSVAVLTSPQLDAATPPNAIGLRAVADGSGRAVVRLQPRTAVVDSMDCGADGAVRLSGALLALDELEVGLAAVGGTPDSWHRARVREGRFDVSVPLTGQGRSRSDRPVATGRYEIQARRPGASPGAAELVLGAPRAALPATFLREEVKVTLSADPAVTVDVAAPIHDGLLRKKAQTRLIERWAGSPRTLEDAVFFCVDLGANASDSALAIHHELQRRGTTSRLYWGVDDFSVAVPDGGIPVLKTSPEWYEKLNTSRYLVNNYGGIWGLSKHRDQRYLQTWHGTPLKFIGASEAKRSPDSAARFRSIAKEASEWDAFLSPSTYMTSLIRSEFGYDGEVLEIGYPRNDRLATATAAEQSAIRAALSLPDTAKVLLYAPTFREQHRSGWKAPMYEGLPLERLLRQLGQDWYLLLRGHSFNARADRRDRSSGRLLDVTQHPDINDLYLASDVLVTDYSSVMFDYSVTGRPMLFFAPDIKRYRTERGMYFDLEEVSPGPVCRDVAHLTAGLHDLDGIRTAYADRYAAFRERFTPWDDGKAAARAVDAFFT